MNAARRDSGRCRELLAELSAYLDGELPAGRCRTLERHLASCTCCGQLEVNLRRAMWCCRKEGQRELPPAVRKRARQKIAELLALADAAPSRRPPRRRA